MLTSDGISESTLREIYQRTYVHRFVDGVADLIGLFPNREVTHVRRAATGLGRRRSWATTAWASTSTCART